MPYIDPTVREDIIDGTRPPLTAGELNFAITDLINDYVFLQGNIDYRGMNEVMGVLECAKQEFYRRVVAPYEDTKCATHGDVYG